MLKSCAKIPCHSATVATSSAPQVAYTPRVMARATPGREFQSAKKAIPAVQHAKRSAAQSENVPRRVKSGSGRGGVLFHDRLIARTALGDDVGRVEGSVLAEFSFDHHVDVVGVGKGVGDGRGRAGVDDRKRL